MGDMTILDEGAASIFRVELSRVRLQLGYTGYTEDSQSDPW